MNFGTQKIFHIYSKEQYEGDAEYGKSKEYRRNFESAKNRL